MKLRDARALIVGAQPELGRAIGSALLDRGARVLLHIEGEEGDLLANGELGQPDHLSSWGLQRLCSGLEDELSCRLMVQQASRYLGGLQVLIVAVLGAGPDRAEDSSLDQWNARLWQDLSVPMLLARGFVDQLPASDQGRIIFLTGRWASRSDPRYLAASVAGAGLVALSRALAIDLGPEITVNVVMVAAERSALDAAAEPVSCDELDGPGGDERIDAVVQALCYLLESGDFLSGVLLPIDA